ncbi:hypothetical protein FNV43_RR26711 [Rhamnella rubrinervis]|uniref:Bet v I/Major latex protein domain-containing protein n=1 Tax=Rhamnella rubrinervis TaxID=2594499 RepID=A0A8K0DJA0_9ROSA|nr:hypothetical protein FNV43_RR26711 [Rhamnella rubrinervis]
MAKIAPEEKESPSSTMLFEVVDHGMVPLQSIEEDEELSEGSLFSIDIDLHRDHDHVEDHSDGIYVAVGKNNNKSSMDALLWTLKHPIISSSSTFVYLVHVFPVVRLIPSPLGMLPKSKVNPRLDEKFVARERDNRRKLLQTYIEACSAAKVKVDTVLIESDMVAKALLDLIPTLNIRKLVVGTSKSNNSYLVIGYWENHPQEKMSSLEGKLETDVEIKAPASKYHEIFKHRPHHVSNHASDFVQGCDLHEGEWGAVDSVICWKYFHDGKPRVAKVLVEAIDDENNTITFKVLEGDLMEEYKSFRGTMKCIPKGDKESVIRCSLEYEKLHDEIIDPHTLLEFFTGLTKNLEKHLAEA